MLYGVNASSRERVVAAIPAALLVVVAVVQIALAHTVQLNPWKGGGFGMFASVDQIGNRRVRAFIETPSGSERVPIPSDFESLMIDSGQLPSRRNLETLASKVARHRASSGEGDETVRIEVIRLEIDLDRMTREERLLATATGTAP